MAIRHTITIRVLSPREKQFRVIGLFVSLGAAVGTGVLAWLFRETETLWAVMSALWLQASACFISIVVALVGHYQLSRGRRSDASEDGGGNSGLASLDFFASVGMGFGVLGLAGTIGELLPDRGNTVLGYAVMGVVALLNVGFWIWIISRDKSGT